MDVSIFLDTGNFSRIKKEVFLESGKCRNNKLLPPGELHKAHSLGRSAGGYKGNQDCQAGMVSPAKAL